MTPLLSYGHVTRSVVHFDDLDPIGIMHNARYGVILERALSLYWAQRGLHFHGGAPSHADAVIATREFQIAYQVPVRGTGEVDVHFWLDDFGTTSAVYGFRFLSTDGRTVHAEGRRVLVKIDPSTGRPSPWTGEFVAEAEKLMREPRRLEAEEVA